jgi:hypothetical protein
MHKAQNNVASYKSTEANKNEPNGSSRENTLPVALEGCGQALC